MNAASIFALVLIVVNCAVAVCRKDLHSTCGWLLAMVMFLAYQGVIE